ncbi:hypothetical protein WMF11_17650 [Sorangium sp. So ce295]|uniref:hypothetical protein n=1 Tax=Sorangium sp. So ce295 TaxID=3133295 RepID=UPI003F60C5EB
MRFKPATSASSRTTGQEYFALHYLCNEFGLPEPAAAAQVAFNDYGIDAFHVAAARRKKKLVERELMDHVVGDLGTDNS